MQRVDQKMAIKVIKPRILHNEFHLEREEKDVVEPTTKTSEDVHGGDEITQSMEDQRFAQQQNENQQSEQQNDQQNENQKNVSEQQQHNQSQGNNEQQSSQQNDQSYNESIAQQQNNDQQDINNNSQQSESQQTTIQQQNNTQQTNESQQNDQPQTNQQQNELQNNNDQQNETNQQNIKTQSEQQTNENQRTEQQNKTEDNNETNHQQNDQSQNNNTQLNGKQSQNNNDQQTNDSNTQTNHQQNDQNETEDETEEQTLDNSVSDDYQEQKVEEQEHDYDEEQEQDGYYKDSEEQEDTTQYNTQQAFEINEKHSVKRQLYLTFYRLVEYLSDEEKHPTLLPGPTLVLNVKKLMMRQYERKPLNAYYYFRTRSQVVLILDNSGSMDWLMDELDTFFKAALKRKDVIIYVAPNGYIQQYYNDKTKHFELIGHEDAIHRIVQSSLPVVYIGDFDGANTPIGLSWTNRVYWVCPETRYKYFKHHGWVRYNEDDFKGFFGRTFDDEEMITVLKEFAKNVYKQRFWYDKHDIEDFSERR